MEDNFLQLNQKLDAILSKAEGTDRRVDSLLIHVDEGFRAVDRRFDSMQAHIDESIDGLATAVKQGFDAVDDRFDAVDSRFVAMDTRFVAMDGRFESIDTRFDKMDTRFDTLEKTVEDLAVATKESFDGIDDRFDELRTEMRDGFAHLTERSKRLDIDLTVATRRINRLESVVGI